MDWMMAPNLYLLSFLSSVSGPTEAPIKSWKRAKTVFQKGSCSVLPALDEGPAGAASLAPGCGPHPRWSRTGRV
eukprot:4245828-Pyramimonas_sp.AAC.1